MTVRQSVEFDRVAGLGRTRVVDILLAPVGVDPKGVEARDAHPVGTDPGGLLLDDPAQCCGVGVLEPIGPVVVRQVFAAERGAPDDVVAGAPGHPGRVVQDRFPGDGLRHVGETLLVHPRVFFPFDRPAAEGRVPVIEAFEFAGDESFVGRFVDDAHGFSPFRFVMTALGSPGCAAAGCRNGSPPLTSRGRPSSDVRRPAARSRCPPSPCDRSR